MPPSHQSAIAFLHSSPLHIETFNALGVELAPHVTLEHVVREDLLVAAETAGQMTDAIAIRTREALMALVDQGAALIVCTCSTLGATAEAAGEASPVPIMRIDRPMADAAVQFGGVIGICAALGPTLKPTEALILDSAKRAGRGCQTRLYLLDDLWTAFREGRLEDYRKGIAARLSDLAGDVDVLVLAQASMAPAAALAGHLEVPVLCSPRLGFNAALRLLVP